MIYTQDNFLPQDEFIALKDRCERRFIAKDGWGTEPVRVTHHDAKGDRRRAPKAAGDHLRHRQADFSPGALSGLQSSPTASSGRSAAPIRADS